MGANSEYSLDIRDNDEDVFASLTVAWKKPDDTWEDSPEGEMLWQEDQLRWTVTLPSEEIPFINDMSQPPTLMKRPHDHPESDFGPVSAQSVEVNPQNSSQFFI